MRIKTWLPSINSYALDRVESFNLTLQRTLFGVIRIAVACFGIGGAVGNTLGGVVVEAAGVRGAYVVGGLLWVATLLLLFVGPANHTSSHGAPLDKDLDGVHDVPGKVSTKPNGTAQNAAEVNGESKEGPGCGSLCGKHWPRQHSVWTVVLESVVGSVVADGHVHAVVLLTFMSVNKRAGNQPYMGVLGITVLGNLFYWGHIPFIQVLAARLDCTPAQAGILASATGWGAAT